MASYLLDTPVLLWWLMDDPRLGASARQVIARPSNEVWVSAASGWEIAIKRMLGKLRAPDNLEARVGKGGFAFLPIAFRHAEQAGVLPLIHRDPFDRMLIAQAQAEDLALITADERIKCYAVRTLAA